MEIITIVVNKDVMRVFISTPLILACLQSTYFETPSRGLAGILPDHPRRDSLPDMNAAIEIRIGQRDSVGMDRCDDIRPWSQVLAAANASALSDTDKNQNPAESRGPKTHSHLSMSIILARYCKY